MLRIAIIGCGKIADQHVAAIHRIPDCEIVALCDRELLMARQLGERFKISACFADLDEMLRTIKPQVVHITTPPQGHFTLAKQCLEAGCHVYLEKPFTVTASETEALIALAVAHGRKITAGHNYQFTLEMLQMRRLVSQGYLGGAPVHLESHWSYELGDSGYVGPILGNRNHWVRQLPGQLFHNLISHGIAKLAEFLSDDLVEVTASAHQSPAFARLGAAEVMDELRVHIRDHKGVTAFFCFSTQYRPALNLLRLYGPKNSITTDILSGTCIRHAGAARKSYLAYFVPPFLHAREYFRATRMNVSNFVRRRLYQDFGMKELIERFYQSVCTDAPVPIPYREIMLTSRIMDEVFRQVQPADSQVRAGFSTPRSANPQDSPALSSQVPRLGSRA